MQVATSASQWEPIMQETPRAKLHGESPCECTCDGPMQHNLAMLHAPPL